MDFLQQMLISCQRIIEAYTQSDITKNRIGRMSPIIPISLANRIPLIHPTLRTIHAPLLPHQTRISLFATFALMTNLLEESRNWPLRVNKMTSNSCKRYRKIYKNRYRMKKNYTCKKWTSINKPWNNKKRNS